MTPVTRNLLFQRRQKRRVRCMAWCLAMSPAGAVGRSVPWDAGRSAGVQSWQDCAAMRSRTLAGGKISPWCIPERSPMTEMCSPASDSGKISPRCVFGRRSVAAFSLHAFPKGPRTGKTPVRGNISPPCIQNEPALARYARRASEKPRKQSSGNTPREDLARKGPFSLRAPLRSCTARRSCHAPTTPNSAGASGGRDMPQPQWRTGPNSLAISTSSMRKARQSLSTTTQGSRRPSRPNGANTSTVSRCTRLISPSFAL